MSFISWPRLSFCGHELQKKSQACPIAVTIEIFGLLKTIHHYLFNKWLQIYTTKHVYVLCNTLFVRKILNVLELLKSFKRLLLC